MVFNLSKVFVGLVAITAATTATALPQKRHAGGVICDYVLQPDVPVDASTTNLVAEFNYVIGRSLSIDTGGSIYNFGSTFTENANNTFNVNNEISADGKTAAETAAIITGWAGDTKQGLSANWLVESVTCA